MPKKKPSETLKAKERMKNVGVKEFRQNFKKYMEWGESFIVERNGKEIGKFIPKYLVTIKENPEYKEIK